MRDPGRPVEKDRLNEYEVRLVVFGSRGFNDKSLFDQCLGSFLTKSGFTSDSKRGKVCFISSTSKAGIDAFLIDWCKEHGYPWVEFVPNWGDIDVEGAVVREKNGRQYNALAAYWNSEEMAEVCTHGLSFYDGVSPDTQDMIDRVADKGHPCAIYLVTIERGENNHAKESSRGASRHS